MSETLELSLGAQVGCGEGLCGQLRALVVDPARRCVTHLVVDPGQARGLGRLVPVDLVDLVAGRLQLRCGAAAFDALEEAQETESLLGYGGGSCCGDGQGPAWPYYLVPRESKIDLELGAATSTTTMTVVYDRVPAGEIELHDGDVVRGTDGPAGTLHGCRIGARDHRLTHVLVREGHLWKRRKVAVPAEAVPAFSTDLHVTLTKDQVRHLPAAEHAGS